MPAQGQFQDARAEWERMHPPVGGSWAPPNAASISASSLPQQPSQPSSEHGYEVKMTGEGGGEAPFNPQRIQTGKLDDSYRMGVPQCCACPGTYSHANTRHPSRSCCVLLLLPTHSAAPGKPGASFPNTSPQTPAQYPATKPRPRHITCRLLAHRRPR